MFANVDWKELLAIGCWKNSRTIPTDGTVNNTVGRIRHSDRRALRLPVEYRRGNHTASGRRALRLLHDEPAPGVLRRQPGGQAELLNLEEILLSMAADLRTNLFSITTLALAESSKCKQQHVVTTIQLYLCRRLGADMLLDLLPVATEPEKWHITS